MKSPIPEQPEDDFQQGRIDLARSVGWRAYHTRDSRRSEPGFPDLIMVRNHCMIVAECKTDTGQCTDDQANWLEAFDKIKVMRTQLWRPKNQQQIDEMILNWGR